MQNKSFKGNWNSNQVRFKWFLFRINSNFVIAIRFLRRLEKSIKTRERIASPSDSCPEENTDDMDSPQASSPLLQPTSPNKTRLALCRQKRLPSEAYGITAAEMNSSNWKGMDRSLIGDDLTSD